MSVPLRHPLAAARADPLKAFKLRCWGRARLWREGEIDLLHEAVDVLQQAAETDGLVAAIGQNEVQAIMAAAFAAVREPAAAHVAPEEVSKVSKRAAASTLEALMYSLRERGEVALAERDCQRRLAELSSAQVREVIGRLIKLRPRYPAVTDDLLFALSEQLPC